MRTDDGNAERFPQLVCAAGMIDMTMRQPDLLDGETVLGNHVEDRGDIAARIHHNAVLRLLIEENRAVLLEGGHRNDTGL